LQANNSRLYAQACDEIDAAGYALHVIPMSPLQFGGIQSRNRLYMVLVRQDIHDKLPAFVPPSPTMRQGATMRDSLLQGDHPLKMPLRSPWDKWTRIRKPEEHKPGYSSTKCEFTTGLPGTANQAYSVDGICPTMTSTATYIYDDTMTTPCIRALHETELCCFAGIPVPPFTPDMTVEDRRRLIGQTMDGYCVKAIGTAVLDYLAKTQCPVAHRLSTLEIHKNYNHPGEKVSQLLGIKSPVNCCICPLGKTKRSPNCHDPVPRAVRPAGRIACDVKEVDTESHDGNTCAFGFVCNFSNRSWVKPMAGRTSADLIECCDELISQDLAGVDIKGIEFVTDNGSAMDSEAFREYCRHPDRQWKLRYSSAHHQHQNPCEHLWARLNGLSTINLSQAPHIGSSTGTGQCSTPTTASNTGRAAPMPDNARRWKRGQWEWTVIRPHATSYLPTLLSLANADMCTTSVPASIPRAGRGTASDTRICMQTDVTTCLCATHTV
jgi:hypothetical protein